MYTVKDYPTKKAMKLDFDAGVQIETFQPGPFPAKTNGTVYLEGPHYPKPHMWYAKAEVANGIITKIHSIPNLPRRYSMKTSCTLWGRSLEGLTVDISFDAIHDGAVSDAVVEDLSIEHDGIELYELLCQETVDTVLEWCHQYIATELAEQIAEQWSFRPEET